MTVYGSHNTARHISTSDRISRRNCIYLCITITFCTLAFWYDQAFLKYIKISPFFFHINKMMRKHLRVCVCVFVCVLLFPTTAATSYRFCFFLLSTILKSPPVFFFFFLRGFIRKEEIWKGPPTPSPPPSSSSSSSWCRSCCWRHVWLLETDETFESFLSNLDLLYESNKLFITY